MDRPEVLAEFVVGLPPFPVMLNTAKRDGFCVGEFLPHPTPAGGFSDVSRFSERLLDDAAEVTWLRMPKQEPNDDGFCGVFPPQRQAEDAR